MQSNDTMTMNLDKDFEEIWNTQGETNRVEWYDQNNTVLDRRRGTRSAIKVALRSKPADGTHNELFGRMVLP